jgi:hypothetical protein
MALKPAILILALAVLPLVGAAHPASAQTVAQTSEPSPPAQHPVRHRIEIHPRPLLYRRCVDWYELQHRPSGTVLYPQMRCHWVWG